MSQKLELSKGYTINRVINGCWQLSAEHCLQGELDFKDAMKAFHELVDAGNTTFDCADIYTGVESFLGEFVTDLKKNQSYKHDDIQIHTKYVPDLNHLADVDMSYTERVIDRSLERLNRETLDLVQFHWWDYDVPGMMETIDDLYKLKEKGKIRNVGMCNFDTPHLKQVLDAGYEVVSNQAQYSVFDRRPEKGLLDLCEKNNVALFCYGTLSGGFLSERWMDVEDFQPETRSHVKYLQIIEDSLGWQGYQEMLKILDIIAKKHNATIAKVATRYILQQPGVGAALVGTRNSKHVKDNTSIFDFELDQEDLSMISKFISNYPNIEGECFELERTPGSKYRNIMKMNLNKAG